MIYGITHIFGFGQIEFQKGNFTSALTWFKQAHNVGGNKSEETFLLVLQTLQELEKIKRGTNRLLKKWDSPNLVSDFHYFRLQAS